MEFCHFFFFFDRRGKKKKNFLAKVGTRTQDLASVKMSLYHWARRSDETLKFSSLLEVKSETIEKNTADCCNYFWITNNTERHFYCPGPHTIKNITISGPRVSCTWINGSLRWTQTTLLWSFQRELQRNCCPVQDRPRVGPVKSWGGKCPSPTPGCYLRHYPKNDFTSNNLV